MMFRKLSKQIRNTIESIRRLCYWIPVVWKDREWDWYYLLRIIERKLNSMNEWYKYTGPAYLSRPMCLSAANIQMQIEQAWLLADKILKNEYCEEEIEAHEKRFGAPLSWFGGGVDDIAYNASPNEDEKAERLGFLAIRKRKDELKQNDLNELARILMENLFDWWD